VCQGAYGLSNLHYFNHPNTHKKLIKTIETATNTISFGYGEGFRRFKWIDPETSKLYANQLPFL
jgi:hypothetical protein